jgi:ABC-type Na+ transport system ATPase subunit NatA
VIEDIEACCDRVIVLHRGVVLFEGTVDELRDRDRDGSAEAAFLAMVMHGAPK